MKEGGYSANHVFISTRGLHFKFETKEKAREFYQVCLNTNKKVVLEQNIVIDIDFANRLDIPQ
ncbi:hypothetical protein IQ235_01020 [Oscillatoriales cyanobacterium LEGE 11467]|uniref:Uncharacterized protein n=1 Tax=Zarconia navalis LEGE 11467 TaxID=1828826 RepID=A0A928VVB2_9CYAN|nr:hypothetical protein [Zarconia navalis]MBE9039377.1 hypothetical protein [Zarconia navalis LEGE 11467]